MCFSTHPDSRAPSTAQERAHNTTSLGAEGLVGDHQERAVLVVTFSERVLSGAERIPPGTVAAFWDLAEYAGSPNGAGAVGGAIHRAREEGNQRVPWWRTVSYLGEITLSGENGQEQARRLRQEGVGLDERGRVRQEFFWYLGTA